MRKVLLFLLVLGVCSSAGATLITKSFTGTVSNFGFYMGTGYASPLFSIGDKFSASIVYDDTTNTLTRVAYQIDNLDQGGGRQFGFSSDGVGYSTYVRPTNFFAYGAALNYVSNWAVTTDNLGGFNFSHNSNMAPVGQPANAYSYNFNAQVPEPMTIGLLGLGALALRRRKA